MGHLTFTSPRALARIERILAALQGKPMTARQLSVQLFMSYALTTFYLRHLQDKPRRVRIADWEPPEIRGRHTPVYALGRNKDAPEPCMTRAEKHAKYQGQREDDPDLRDAFLARKRAREWRARRRAGQQPRPANDPLLGWIQKPQERKAA